MRLFLPVAICFLLVLSRTGCETKGVFLEVDGLGVIEALMELRRFLELDDIGLN